MRPTNSSRPFRSASSTPLLIAVASSLSLFLTEQYIAFHVEARNQNAAEILAYTSDESVDVRPLNPNTPIKRDIEGGQNHFYEFTLPAGFYMHAVVDQQGIDVVVSIHDRAKNVVAEVDRSNGARGPEAISMITADGGTFRLRVHARRGGSPKAPYGILMENPRPSAPADGIRINAEKLTFEAVDLYSKSQRVRGGEKLKLVTKSIEKYQEARAVWHSLNEPYEEALTFYGLGWSFSDLGSHDMVKFPLPLYRLRWSYDTRGDHQNAVRYFNQALTIMRALGDKHGQAITLAGMAWPNLYLGNEEEALNSFSDALLLFEATGNPDGEARALYGIGWVQALLGKNDAARDSFSKSLPLRQAVNDKRGEAITLASLGRIYGLLGNEQQALTFAERARLLFKNSPLNDSHGVASTLSTDGWSYYSLRRYPEAIDSFQRAFKLRDENDITGRANALYGIARVERERGKLMDALGLMKRVIEVIDPLRTKGSNDELRTYYFANVQEYYGFYTELLMRLHKLQPQRGYAETALWCNERARARELVAILAEAIPDAGDEANLESAKSMTASDIQGLLDKDTLLLEYALTDKRAYLWTVTASPIARSSTEGYELPNGALSIERAALNLIDLLKGKGGTVREFETAADALSRMLIPRNVVAQIKKKRRVVIVADGILQYVPFVTMSISGRPRIYNPLVADHEVVTVPSMSTLSVLRLRIDRRTPAVNAITVLADPVFRSNDVRVTKRTGTSNMIKTRDKIAPDYNSDASNVNEDEIARMLVSEGGAAATSLKFKRLPSTRDEAEIIRSLEPRTRMELDFDANLRTVAENTLGSYRIVHFATHGIALDSHPEASGIFLSMVNEQGEPQDGYLYFARACRLHLPVELVVLSGCDTNFGKSIRGEGLIGLTRGFMYAGASRVVATLWKVRGEATKELMKRFYAAVLRGGVSPSSALSAAQGSMWREQRWTPSNWAGFVFSGEWR